LSTLAVLPQNKAPKLLAEMKIQYLIANGIYKKMAHRYASRGEWIITNLQNTEFELGD